MSKLPSQSPVHPWSQTKWSGLGSLKNDLFTEVLIVGAGIAGLSTAYVLAKRGHQVTVIDASKPGDGETGNTSAHLSSALDEQFTQLEKLFGEEGSRLAAESHRMAIDAIEAICREEKIECQFERVPGYLFAADTKDNDLIQDEAKAAERAGFTHASITRDLPFKGFDNSLALIFPQQGKFHPMLYLKGLTRALKTMDVPVFTDCEAVELEEKGKRIQVKTRSGQTIDASKVVVASNTPWNDRFAMHTKQAPYRTYMVGFQVAAGSFPNGLFWDTQDPYHYIRTAKMDDETELLIVGGEDHKVGQSVEPEESWAKIERWVQTHIPAAGAVVKRWSGQVNEPTDGLAFIGRNPGDENIFIITGDSGHGLTHGTIAGFLLSDLIEGNKNPWEKLYDPARANLHKDSLKEFFKENVNVGLQYRDYFTGGDVTDISEIAPGQGAIVRQGLSKLAVFRDEKNQVHACSAVCPHLGGLVRWNNAEKSWDCPCHGSRFDTHGAVLNGPAISGLKMIKKSDLLTK